MKNWDIHPSYLGHTTGHVQILEAGLPAPRIDAPL